MEAVKEVLILLWMDLRKAFADDGRRKANAPMGKTAHGLQAIPLRTNLNPESLLSRIKRKRERRRTSRVVVALAIAAHPKVAVVHEVVQALAAPEVPRLRARRRASLGESPHLERRIVHFAFGMKKVNATIEIAATIIETTAKLSSLGKEHASMGKTAEIGTWTKRKLKPGLLPRPKRSPRNHLKVVVL